MISASLDLSLLNDWLRHGDLSELAERMQVSRMTIYKVRSGEKKNFEILEALYEIAIERAAKFKAYEEKLKSLTPQS